MPRARLSVWGPQECEAVHGATLQVLKETGVDVRSPGLWRSSRGAARTSTESESAWNRR